MLQILRNFIKSLPTLLLSFTLAVAVWISAVNSADPVQARIFPQRVTIEQLNLDPSLVISNEVPAQATVTLSAPNSVWNVMLADRAPVRAWIDLAGLKPGRHTLEVKIQPLHQPVREVSKSPRTVEVILERLLTQELPISLERRGEPAIGFRADPPVLSHEAVTVTGPESNVQRVRTARTVIDLTQASDNLTRVLNVQVLDENGLPVEDITIIPSQVTLTQPITQMGGYRNVVIKVITTGQPAQGYRLTNVSVSPPTISVFSNNPQLVESLPGFVETNPLDLTGVKDDVERRLPLNLPTGVSVVGEQNVAVQVGVAAIEDSVTLSGLVIRVTGLPPELMARLSPTTVDVIISGPVPLLDRLKPEDISVVIDLTNVVSGTYQFAPRVSLAMPELRVESILPSSIEVVVELAPTPTPSPTPTRTPRP
jgi:YbbR domain-containing protein